MPRAQATVGHTRCSPNAAHAGKPPCDTTIAGFNLETRVDGEIHFAGYRGPSIRIRVYSSIVIAETSATSSAMPVLADQTITALAHLGTLETRDVERRQLTAG